MLVKLLGIFDLLCVIFILASRIMPHGIMMTFGMILALKGGIFFMSGNRVSILDILGGIYMGLLIYGISNKVVTFFFAAILIQKGVFSLLAR